VNIVMLHWSSDGGAWPTCWRPSQRNRNFAVFGIELSADAGACCWLSIISRANGPGLVTEELGPSVWAGQMLDRIGDMMDLSTEGLRTWMLDTLVPSWADHAVDDSLPGYIEAFSADRQAHATPYRTTLVTARLVYVFSHAYTLHPNPEILAAAEHGMTLLRKVHSTNGALPRSVRLDGVPDDSTVDLYDLAFVLFACAWYHLATGDQAALALADETAAFIRTQLAHPAAGFAEDTAGTQPRRQNPHMHLLEALHALAQATGQGRWLDWADAIVDLMADRFVDDAGTLGEFFGDDWTPIPGVQGAIREPGHHFEWVWLLLHHRRLTGDTRAGAIAENLYQFGLTHGIDRRPGRSALAFDAVDPKGKIIQGTKLLWPQTEAIKAFGARWELAGDSSARDLLASHLATMFRHYINYKTAFWRNQLSEDETPLSATTPSRVLYHVFLCLAETVRIGALPTSQPAASA
jgi:mannose/cellobiose epimerase-like protein (N-acyl-D-glucosamine 2-epimerase family)